MLSTRYRQRFTRDTDRNNNNGHPALVYTNTGSHVLPASFSHLSRSDRARAPLTLRSCTHMHHASRRSPVHSDLFNNIVSSIGIHFIFQCALQVPTSVYNIYNMHVIIRKQTSDLAHVSRCYEYTNVIPDSTQLSARHVNVCIIL